MAIRSPPTPQSDASYTVSPAGRKRPIPLTTTPSKKPARKRKSAAISDSASETEEDFEATRGPKVKTKKKGKLRVLKERPAPPYKWTVSHQLIWMKTMNRKLPTRFFSWPSAPFESVASPANVDLSVLSIELTACELLTFFPRHFYVPEYEDRLCRNGIQGAWQAMFIVSKNLTIPRRNRQRHLHTPQHLISMHIRTQIKRAKSLFPPTIPPTPCTVYTTSHYKFTSAHQTRYDDEKIVYPLINCADGVHSADFPAGADAGPFTKALVHAQVCGHLGIALEERDRYIEGVGIERGLEEGHSDEGFLVRWDKGVKKYQGVLKEEAERMGFQWES